MYNIVQLCGRSRSPCGYCRGERANCVPQRGDEETITSENSSKCYGALFQALTCEDYQHLLDKGWRRSGKHLYKPHNWESCCPAISIRLDSNRFRISKSQKRVLRHIERVLEGQQGQSSKEKKKEKNANPVEETMKQSNILTELKNWTLQALTQVLSSSSSSCDITTLDELMEKCPFKYRKNNPSKTESTQRSCMYYTAICAALIGRGFVDDSSSFLHKVVDKLNGFVLQKKKLKLDTDHGPCVEISSVQAHEKSSQIHVYFTVPDDSTQDPMAFATSSSTAATNSETSMIICDEEHAKPDDFLTQFLFSNNESNNVKNTLTVRSIPCEKSAEDPEVHRLYAKYQHAVHGDPNPFDTREKDHDFKNDTEVKKSFQSFYTFLCNPPLIPYLDQSFHTNFDVDSDGYDVSIPYGCYHQQYRLNDRLIAVGVVDVLPRCLSSVYSFYDPILTKSLNLGKYTALREIEWVKRASQKRPSLQYYYLGYYIHSCPKMTYKAEYKPSELLCPTHEKWVDLEQAVDLIRRFSPIQHCCTFVTDGKSPTEPEEKTSAVPKPLLESMLLNITPPEHRTSTEGDDEDEISASRIRQEEMLSQCVPISRINSHGRKIVDPLVTEFMAEVGLAVSRNCIIQL